MKKILAITVALVFAASSAFAAASLTMSLTKANTGKTLRGVASGTTAATSPQLGKCSTGVGLGMLVVATGTGYSLVTQHINGTKAYGSSYDSTSIYSRDAATVGTPVLAVPTNSTSGQFTTGWTSI